MKGASAAASLRALWAKQDGSGLLLVGAWLLLALLCGAALPLLGVLVPAAFLALGVVLAVFLFSPLALIGSLLGLSFLVVGQLTFFAGVSQAVWLPYLLLVLISVKCLMEAFRPQAAPVRLPTSAPGALLLLFLLVFAASAVVNRVGPLPLLVAAKNYLFPWFLTLLMLQTLVAPEALRRVWLFFLWLVPLQLPFALVQHFVFARLPGASWDAVVGTFGGNFLRGGGSGGMAICVGFGLLLALALRRAGQIGRGLLLTVWLSGLATIALAEVKIFFLMLPVGLVLLLRRELLRHPLRALSGLLGGLLLLGAVGWVYQQVYSETLNRTRTVEGLLDYAFQAESDPYLFNPVTRELSRSGALLMWARYNDLDDHRAWLGHGPAASRESATLGQGGLTRKYPFTLTTSTASTLLWDTGLAGLGAFLLVCASAGLVALRLARRRERDGQAWQAATLEAAGVMLLLELPLAFYNRDAIDVPARQVLLAFLLGHVLMCRRGPPGQGDAWPAPRGGDVKPPEPPVSAGARA